MGWDFCHRDKGLSTLEFFQRQFPEHVIVASGFGAYDSNGKPWYAAMHHKDSPEDVFAIVILTKTSKDYFNFGYKVMDEGMGPNADDCPERVLKALTGQGAGEYAQNWRSRAWANLEKKKALGKVRKGDIVRFPAVIEFTNGDRMQEFLYLGGSDFRAHGRIYRIRNWKSYHPEVCA